MSQSQFQEFLAAAKAGDCKTVKHLLPFVDPKSEKSKALRGAAKYGRADVVKLLLPLSDPKEGESESLRYAAYYGHTEVVSLLLPVSNPRAEQSEALRWAARNDHREIVNLLYQASDAKHVLRSLQKNGETSEGISYLKQLFKSGQDKEFLESNVLSKKTDKYQKVVIKKM